MKLRSKAPTGPNHTAADGDQRVLVGMELGELDPRSALDANLTERKRLEGEQAKLTIGGVRQILLVAVEEDALAEKLDAARAAPPAAFVLHDVGAHLSAAAAEAGANRPIRRELVVMVAGDAAAEFKQLERAPAERDVDPGIGARLRPSMIGSSASMAGSSEKRIGTP